MDSLSMTASLAALLQVTGKIAAYINELRKASEEQQSIAIEAGQLYTVLTKLKFRVSSVQSTKDPWFAQLKALNRTDGPLTHMKRALDEIDSSLPQSASSIHRMKAVVTWHWSKTEVRELLQKIQRLKSLIDSALALDHFTLSQTIHSDIQELHGKVDGLDYKTKDLHNLANRDIQDKISHWLKLSDPALNLQAARKLRHGTTGSWLLSHSVFVNWRDSDSSMLWIHGKAGCGKTVLSSTMINSLQDDTKHILAYFYFDFRDVSKQSPSQALRSILFQTALRHDGLADLQQSYTQHNGGTQHLSDEASIRLLKTMVSIDQPIYIVLDALDECMDRVQLLDCLGDLQGTSGMRIAVTSRKERDLEEGLLAMTNHCINVESSLVDCDIALYVQEQVSADMRLSKWNRDIRQEIINVLTSKANGMFRWVACQLEVLRKCRQIRKLKETLAKLPRTLTETYDRILQNIEADEQIQGAMMIMQWMCFAQRTLTLQEAADLLTLQTDVLDEGLCLDNRLQNPEDLSTICSGFLEIVYYEIEDGPYAEGDFRTWKALKEHDNHYIVRLAHFSVKEYFMSDQCCFREQFETCLCNAMIARGCLRYLLDTCRQGPMTRKLLKQYPLAKYGAENWFVHMREIGNCPQEILELAIQFLEDDNGLLLLSRLNPLFLDLDWHDELPDLRPRLCFAAVTGLLELVRNTIKTTNWSHEIYGQALVTASERGHLNVVQLLLESGAEIDFMEDHETALSTAFKRNDVPLVKYLLEAGANPLICQSSFKMYTREESSEQACHLLLDANADLTSDFRKASLSTNIMRRILEKGIDLNARDFAGRTVLQNACERGNIERVQLLIDAGVDVNAVTIRTKQGFRSSSPSPSPENALVTAVESNHPEIVEVLIKVGARIRDEPACNDILHRAAQIGNPRTVNVLLDAGIDVDQTVSQLTALQIASVSGHGATVKRLLESAATVNASDGQYGTALQAACSYSKFRVEVEMKATPSFDVTVGCIPYNSTSIIWKGPKCRVRLSLAFVSLTAILAEKETQAYEESEAGEEDEGVCGDSQDVIDLGYVEYFEEERDPVYVSVDEDHEDNEDGEGVTALKHVDYVDEDDEDNIHVPIYEDDGNDDDTVNVSDQESSEDQDQAKEALKKRNQHRRKILRGSILPIQNNDNYNKAIADLLPPRAPKTIQYKWRHEKAGRRLAGDLSSTLETITRLDWHRWGYRKVIRRSLDLDWASWRYMFHIKNSSTESFTQALLNLGACVQPKLNGSLTDPNVLPDDPRHELVQLLLDHGADVNAVGGHYGFALQAAAHNDLLEACRLLIAHGADVNLVGGVYGTALQAAAANLLECMSMVQQLLLADADVNIKGGEYGCALSAACYRGHINIVRCLIDAGADVNLQGGTYGNPLQAACASIGASLELVQLLIDAGADIVAEGGKFGTAYGACMSKRYQAAVLVSDKQYEEVLRGEASGADKD